MSKTVTAVLKAPSAKADSLLSFKEVLSVEALYDCKGRRFLKFKGKPDTGKPVSAFAFGDAVAEFSDIAVGDPLQAVVSRSRKAGRTFIKLTERRSCQQLQLALAA